MKSNYTLIEFAELIISRPGSNIVFKLASNGKECQVEHTKHFGLLVGLPGTTISSIYEWEELDEWDLSRELDPIMKNLSDMTQDYYDRMNITVVSLSSVE